MRSSSYQTNPFDKFAHTKVKKRLPPIILAVLLIALAVLASGTAAQKSDKDTVHDQTEVRNMIKPLSSEKNNRGKTPKVFQQYTVKLAANCSFDLVRTHLDDMLASGELKQAPVLNDRELWILLPRESLQKISNVACVEDMAPGWLISPVDSKSNESSTASESIPPRFLGDRSEPWTVTNGTGSISGRVNSEAGGSPINSIEVCAYISVDLTWQLADCVYTDTNGDFTVSSLQGGTYRVEYFDYLGIYLSEFYDNAADLVSATDIVVTDGNETSGIDATLMVLGHISGTVTADANGEPVSEIEVCSYLYNGSYWEGVSCVYTNIDGIYDIKGLDSGTYRVGFIDHSASYLDEYYDNVPNLDSATDISVVVSGVVTNIDAALTELGHIKGAVTAEVSGEPLTGIQVCSYFFNESYWESVGCSHTDVDGTYDIGRLNSGIYRVGFYDQESVYLGEYYDNARDIDAATDIDVVIGGTVVDIDAVLSDVGHISGNVTAEADGEFLDGIEACAYFDNGSYWEGAGCDDTDTSGDYDISGLATDSFRVGYYDSTGFYMSEYYDAARSLDSAADIGVTAGSTTANIDATLLELGHITGKVTAEGSWTPVRDIEVCAYIYDEDYWDYWLYNCDITDAAGDYDIERLPTAAYRVGFFDASGAYINEFFDNAVSIYSANDVLVTAGSKTNGINATLTKPGHISGTVTDEVSGAKLYDIEVCAFYFYDESYWEYADCGYTDIDGNYIVENLASGPYRLEFTDYNGSYLGEYYDNALDFYDAADIFVSAGNTTSGIDATLAEPGQIPGTVTAETGGAPLDGIRVCAYHDTGLTWQQIGSCSYTDTNGQYNISGLPPRTYRVRFYDYNGIYAFEYYDNTTDINIASDVAVNAGSITSGIDAALSDAGHITGTVTANDDGTALDDVEVCLYLDYGYSWKQVDCIDTNLSGNYDIGGLSAGNFRLEFIDYNYRYAAEFYDDKPDIHTATDIALAAGEIKSDIDAGLSLLPPPDHDDFDAAREVTSTPFQDVVGVQGATTAIDDPYLNCSGDQGYGSVWYEIAAENDSSLSVDTIGSDFDTVLTIWGGSRGSLVELTCNDDYGVGLESRVENVKLSAGTTYYVEVTSLGSGLGELVLNVELLFDAPFTDCMNNTGSNASVAVPDNVVVNGGLILDVGDEFALFTPDGEICAGHGVWTDSSLGLTVWGDNIQTSEIDGFVAGQQMMFQVWDKSAGILHDRITVTYNQGEGLYSADSIHVVLALDIDTTLTQDLPLSTGWHMISSYIEPDSPVLETLLVGIENDMILMKDSDGQIYWPSMLINNIGDWEVHQGYQIFMDNPAILSINGRQIDPPQTPIELQTGWSMITYLRDSSMPVSQALNSISGELYLVKNGYGEVYWPAYSVNQIGNMHPGQGYQVYLETAGTLVYATN